MMERRRSISSVAAYILIASLCASGAAASASDEARFRFGAFTHQIDSLAQPTAVEIDPDGNLHVLESTEGRISIFTRDGDPVRSIEIRDAEGRGCAGAEGMILWGRGYIITDTGNHRVLIVNDVGDVVREWGEWGDGEGAFSDPVSAAARDGAIHIVDRGNHRIQTFTAAGEFIRAFGMRGSGPGEFVRPQSIATDLHGNLIITDSENHRIQVFTADGKFIRSFGAFGPFGGLFERPVCVRLVGDEVFVVDRSNHRIQAFAADGTFRDAWGVHEIEFHQGRGRLHYPTAMAISPDGAFGVVCETIEDRVQFFAAREGEAEAGSRQAFNKTDQTHFGERLSIEGRLLVISEPENHYHILYDISQEVPIIINHFGERGEGGGLFLEAADYVLETNHGRVFVLDAIKRELQEHRFEYDPPEALVFFRDMTRFSRSVDLAEDTLRPVAMARSSDGRWFVVDADAHRVVIFDAAFNVVGGWGGWGEEPGRFRRPTDIVIDAQEKRVHIVDSLNRRVQIFSIDGELLRVIKPMDGEVEMFTEPFGIAMSPDGRMLVSDPPSHRVIALSPEGEAIGSWGEPGAEIGEFWKPKGLAIAADSRVFVVDQGNHRMQVFTIEGEWLASFGTGRALTRRNRPRSGQ